MASWYWNAAIVSLVFQQTTIMSFFVVGINESEKLIYFEIQSMCESDTH